MTAQHGPIALAVMSVTRLQEIAENDHEVKGADFHRRWNILAFTSQRAINGHEIAAAEDAAVKRGAA